jgi:hypothetical protein
MARFFRIAILMACILLSGRAFAAGGSCPSGANYVNPATTTGALVTLASLGITSCYYVAANGADTNTGTDEGHPFLHSQGMGNCSGNCASATVAAGVGWIFRGGDTWHFGNPAASPYAGVVSACSNNGTVAGAMCLQSANGTTANPIYFGVDKSWFSGASWTRPILTGDNPLCNPNTLSASCLTDILFGPAGVREYYVTSCQFQIGGSSNNMFELSNMKNYIVDNFEITGICGSILGQIGHHNVSISYGGAGGPLTFVSNYFHGWTHVKFAAQNASPNCTVSNVCINGDIFTGSVLTTPGENILFNVIDGCDSDPAAGELGFIGAYNMAYNVIRCTSGSAPRQLHVFHDNLYELFYENGHSDVLASANNSEPGPITAIYNNVFRHIDTVGATGSVILWPYPNPGNTDYVFNNLIYDVGNVQYNDVGNHNQTVGNYVYFNNTFQSNVSQAIFRCELLAGGTLTDVNNHLITEASSYFTVPTCNGRLALSLTPLFTNNAGAKASGYTASEPFAFSPSASNSPSVGKGTNEGTQGLAFCNTLLASSDPLIQVAGIACTSDTTYACMYDSQNHTVSCPTRNVVARPASAWDIGAYQSTSAQAGTPNPPTGLRLTVQ